MASTATFAGPFSFDEIFHYIFGRLGLYFVDNGTNLLFEFLNFPREKTLLLASARPDYLVSSSGANRKAWSGAGQNCDVFVR